MKKFYLFGLFLLFACVNVSALPKYWIGPLNGNWNNGANWSLLSGGIGGAGVPGIADSVIFEADALVNLDVSPVVNTMLVTVNNGKVTLYTSANRVFTILGNLDIAFTATLKDSTSANVLFDFTFNAATNATGSIKGNWIFEGGVPVSASAGARFSAPPGTNVSVMSNLFANVYGTIRFKANTNTIVSNASTLTFGYSTYFIQDDNINAYIPDATWARDTLLRIPFIIDARASTIEITGRMGVLKHLGVPHYGRLVINLNNLSADASLDLPDGTTINSDIEILNTNNFTLTLLAQTGPASKVHVLVGTLQEIWLSTGLLHRGSLLISGATTKVALATGTASAPQTSYRLQLSLDFQQTGGNFSLQDYNNPLDSTTLAIRKDFIQTGGTFTTNSTTTNPVAAFILEMNGPIRYSGPGSFHQIGQDINVSSGTIDNGRNMVSLRMLNSFFVTLPQVWNVEPEGISLLSPLSVGKLELLSGTLNTSQANMLTITNPDAKAAVVVDTSGRSYVNGPFRRVTNSTNAYVFPTGKSNFPERLSYYSSSAAYMHYDSVVIKPVTTALSVYQAEYFHTGYPDSQNVLLPLNGISKTEYWGISRITGADATVTFTLNSIIPGATNLDGIVVAHYVNGQWIAENGTVLTPGNTSAGSVESKPLSTFGPFTFGYINAPGGPLPVRFISLDVQKVNGGARLEWKVAEIVSRFEIMKSTDGSNYSLAGTVNSTPGKQLYQYFDASLQKGTTYYRIRSIEIDGNASLSKVVLILNGGKTTEIATMAPTIVESTADLYISSSKGGQMELIVSDMKGRTWKKFRLMVTAGNTQNRLYFGDLSSGVYQVSGYMNGEKTSSIRFIRQ